VEDDDIQVLSGDAAYSVILDARIVAIRWDVVDWGVVFDLDCPLSEASDAPYARGWLAFVGLSDLSLPLKSARVPQGLWSTTELSVEHAEGDLFDFGFRVQLLDFAPDGSFHASPLDIINVRAQGVVGLRTTRHICVGGARLSFDQRQALGSDETMRAALARGMRRVHREK